MSAFDNDAENLSFEKKVEIIRSSIAGCRDFLDSNDSSDDIIIVIGNSKGGKSTLINYIMGNSLVSVEEEEDFKVKLAVKDNSFGGPKIGLSATSETTVPSKYMSINPQLPDTIWDTPGFGDNRGVVQDIPNAFYIKTLLTHAKSVKVVLVTDFNDIRHDNIKQFLLFLEHVCTMFRTVMDIVKGFSIVFTKAEAKFDQRKICILLKNKILDQTQINLRPECRQLVQHFVSNSSRIGIMKAVEDPDLEYDCFHACELDNGIHKAIGMSERISHEVLAEVVQFGISLESEKFLLEAYNHLCMLPELSHMLKLLEEWYVSSPSPINSMSEGDLYSHCHELGQRGLYISQLQPISVFQSLTYLAFLSDDCSRALSATSIELSMEFIGFIESIIYGLRKTESIQLEVLKSISRMQKGVQIASTELQYKLKVISITEATSRKAKLEEEDRVMEATLSKSTIELENANEEVANSRLTALGRVGHSVAGAVFGFMAPAAGVVISASDAMSEIDDASALIRVPKKFGVVLGAAVATPIALGIGALTMIGGIGYGALGYLNQDTENAATAKRSEVQTKLTQQQEELAKVRQLKREQEKKLQIISDELAKCQEELQNLQDQQKRMEVEHGKMTEEQKEQENKAIELKQREVADKLQQRKLVKQEVAQHVSELKRLKNQIPSK